jgi:hypothetical protein
VGEDALEEAEELGQSVLADVGCLFERLGFLVLVVIHYRDRADRGISGRRSRGRRLGVLVAVMDLVL